MSGKSFTDELFVAKNKDYGGYVLRKKYNKHLSISFLTAIFVFSVFVLGPLIQNIIDNRKSKSMLEQKEKRVLDYAKMSAPPPIEIDRPKEPPQKKDMPKATVKYVKPTVKPDDEVIDEVEMADLDELKNKQIGVEDIEGDTSNIYESDYESYDEVIIEEEEAEVFIFVSEMPSFPGGESALLNYIAENIKYPQIARENNIQGLVITQFVIDREGNVTNISILRGIGFGCDEEAIRVIESMPKWKPGKQGDRIVPVQYSLPIRFVVKSM